MKECRLPENAVRVNENVPENVPENRLNAIIGLIKISMLELANYFRVNHKTIKRDIAKLKSCGLLERVGAAKGGYWKINKK